MDRLKRSNEGFTLLELAIAIALSAVVLLAASNLLINFGKFTSSVVKSEASLMATSLGAFEEIVGNIAEANVVSIPAADPTGSKIILEEDTPVGSPLVYTPTVFTDDTVHTYWLDGSDVKYTSKVGAGAESSPRTIATDVHSLLFEQGATNKNEIQVTLEAQATSWPTSLTSKEKLKTTVIMRSRRSVA